MEANENNEPKKESSPIKQNTEKEKTPEASENKNMNIYDQYKKEKESHQESNKIPEVQNYSCPAPISNNSNPSEKELSSQEGIDTPQQKVKRRRRGKSEINDRKYSCPDCDKCYLSGPALTTHRKNKHGYGVLNSGEKEKRRGRPKKEEHSEGNQNFQLKYNAFFDAEHRKRIIENLLNNNEDEKDKEEKEIELNKVKNIIIKIFDFYKEKIFKGIDNIDKYSFYNLIIENWDKPKDNIFPADEIFCYSASNIKNESPKKINSYNIDQIFFLYLKEFSKKVNDDYLWFMTKFIVLFRECINSERHNLIKQENVSDKRILYTQIYNAETVPEICNSFYLSYLQPNDFFGLNQEELIELIQHFCNWLNINNYTRSKLTLL